VTAGATSAGAVTSPSPRDSVARALRAGRYRVAYRALEEAPGPLGPTDRVRMALCLLQIGRPAEAASLLASVPLDSFQTPYRDYWTALARYKNGEYATAAATFDTLARAAPPSPMRDAAQVWVLQAAAASGNRPLAEEAIARLVARSDQLAAVGWLDRMRLDRATWESAWLVLLQRYPGTGEAYQAAGSADSMGWQAAGDLLVALARLYEGPAPGKAIRIWTRALSDVSLASRRGEIRYRLAELFANERNYGPATQRLREILADSAAQAQWPKALRLFATIERRRNNEARSRSWDLRFVMEYPASQEAPDALWSVGMSWEREGICDSAVQVYQRIADVYRTSPVADAARWRVGFCAYRAGDFLGAHQHFAQLAQETKDYALADQSQYWAGKALYQAGRVADAYDAWSRGAAFSPRTCYAVMSAATVGKPIVPPEEAQPPRREPRREPASWPGFAEAQWLATLGQYAWARSVLTDRAGPLAESIDAKEDLADAFEEIGDYAAAARWRSRAMWSRITDDRYYTLPAALLGRIWPDFYRDEVIAAAIEARVEPALLWAIMRQESMFDSDVRSGADARGLMQLLPATGRAVARRIDAGAVAPSDLYDARLNVRLGAQYVADLLRQFDDRIDCAAAGYNGGPANVVRWESTSDGDPDVFRETITYGETRTYVKLVVRNYLIYRSLYPDAQVIRRQP